MLILPTPLNLSTIYTTEVIMPTISTDKVTLALRILQATCGTLLVALSIVCFTNKSHMPHPNILQSPAFYTTTSGAGAVIAAGLGHGSMRWSRIPIWLVIVLNLVVAAQMGFAFVMSVWLEPCRDYDWNCHLANAKAAFEMIGLVTAVTMVYLDATMWRRQNKQAKKVAGGAGSGAWFGQNVESGRVEQWPGKVYDL
ncbi:hypothetical protein EJ03DRAFT_357987 [Teratosphaeria nubilosa]|uniref:MARVEL domain-containing protein n=1 Tax=Teratosphaeria nubilosa TaxID=161662 RepID=A0A6G1KVB1_9PEZI|nr:hypothetical protein EJ03DRAFT_357987 [Teratosphaeria nubilosa]